MIRSLTKHLDIKALRHNYDYLHGVCKPAKLVAVIKSEAYGHGLLRVAKALSDADGFAVACVSEGIALRRAGILQKVIILQGGHGVQDIDVAQSYNLTLVVHCQRQLDWLQQNNCGGLDLWIKFDTGMHRLGFALSEHKTVISAVLALRDLHSAPVLMSHFGCADEDDAYTLKQLKAFEELCAHYREEGLEASIANSAAALSISESHKQWVRSGLAVYGVSTPHTPKVHRKNLKPVMHVTAPVIATRTFNKGDRLGYGGTYVCQQATRIALVGAGYGDGYPWHAKSGTPVWLNSQQCGLAGRVSMDMIAVDVTNTDVQVGDYAELWGNNIPVSEVAKCAATIPYELLCAMSSTATTLR